MDPDSREIGWTNRKCRSCTTHGMMLEMPARQKLDPLADSAPASAADYDLDLRPGEELYRTLYERAVGRLAGYRDRLRELNAELLRAEEREDRRIARVLHDELGQTLAAARMAVCELEDSEVSAARAVRLQALLAHLDRSIEVTRSLTFQLSPPILHDLGLAAALEALGERTREDHGLRFVFVLDDGWSPPAAHIGVVLYRVARELLRNVARHARANSVRLTLGGNGDRLRIVLEDDGAGFDAAGAARAATRRDGGLGLFQARERMARLGGSFEIDSAPGRGTRAVLSLPLTGCRCPHR